MKKKALLILLVVVLVLTLLCLTECKWNHRSSLKFRLVTYAQHAIRKGSLMSGMACLNARACKDNLCDFHDAMETAGIPFWLSEGTALGVRREGDIMAHDDDVDVSVHAVHLDHFVRDVVPALKRRGFAIAKVWNEGRFITFLRHGEALDVDFVSQGQVCMFDSKGKVGWGHCCELDKMMQGLRPVTFLGRQFHIPDDEYLEFKYGKQWMKSDAAGNRCAARKASS